MNICFKEAPSTSSCNTSSCEIAFLCLFGIWCAVSTSSRSLYSELLRRSFRWAVLLVLASSLPHSCSSTRNSRPLSCSFYSRNDVLGLLWLEYIFLLSMGKLSLNFSTQISVIVCCKLQNVAIEDCAHPFQGTILRFVRSSSVHKE